MYIRLLATRRQQKLEEAAFGGSKILMTKLLAAIGVCIIVLGVATPTVAMAGGGGCGPAGHQDARHVGHGNRGPGSQYYCQPGVCNAR